MARIYNKRGTRANLNTLAASNGLAAGEIYLITDENRLAMGLSANTYETYALESEAGGGGSPPAWSSKIIGAFGNGDPNDLAALYQSVGNSAASPTQITTSIARCSLFRLADSIVVNRARYRGINVVTSSYRVAIYRYSDGARLTGQLTFDTPSSAMASVDLAGALTLDADELYIMACAVSATGTNAGVGCFTAAVNSAAVLAAPQSNVGNMDTDAGYMSTYLAQFSVTSGDLPSTLPTLSAPSSWGGGMPSFWLDNDTTA